MPSLEDSRHNQEMLPQHAILFAAAVNSAAIRMNVEQCESVQGLFNRQPEPDKKSESACQGFCSSSAEKLFELVNKKLSDYGNCIFVQNGYKTATHIFNAGWDRDSKSCTCSARLGIRAVKVGNWPFPYPNGQSRNVDSLCEPNLVIAQILSGLGVNHWTAAKNSFGIKKNVSPNPATCSNLPAISV
jgi:hypothetical protein